ncbi:MAG TPA: OmpA family protein [Rectinemataceae bacterium]|nr:OmpA family protein [Rectinemataceae bacterium]
MSNGPRSFVVAIAVASLVALVGCQSAPPRPDPTEPSSIKALSEGFSPTGSQASSAIKFSLSFGDRAAVQSWSVKIATGSVVLKEFSGVGGADLPDTLSWDGRNSAGMIWPEGQYYAFLDVGYGDAYNPATISWAQFNLVSSPPTVKAEATPTGFTPAVSGMEAPLTLSLSGSSRFAQVKGFEADILGPDGTQVRSFTAEGSAATILWDGKTDDGAWVEPSRTYTALLRAFDQYGNVGETKLSIAVAGQPNAPERSVISASSAGFSPTGDPSRRSMNFALTFGNVSSMRSWAVEILSGTVVLKRFEGGAAKPPSSLAWDGKSATGAFWPEGEYQAALSIDYGTTFNPVRVLSQKFKLVASTPALKLSADPAFFTPAGQGMREPLAIKLAASSPLASIVGWTLDLRNKAGSLVRSFGGSGALASISWDGKLADGTWAEPGFDYKADAVAVDEYGNRGLATLTLPVRPSPLAPEASLVETEAKGFSPAVARNGGALALSVKIGDASDLATWKLSIIGASGPVRTWSGDSTNPPSDIAWDGSDDAKAPAPEGSYFAQLVVDYGRTWQRATARSTSFVLATTAPVASLAVAPDHFTPSESGVSAPLALILDAKPGLGALLGWNLDILDSQGSIVKTFSRDWPANQILWDGSLDGGGWVAPASSYIARATLTDEYGNVAIANAKVAVADIPSATEPSVIEPRSAGFSPQAISRQKTIDFLLVAGNRDRMKSWKIVFSHSERGAQRSLQGDASSFPKSLDWDGMTDAGTLAPDGGYFATLTIDYGKTFKPAMVRSSSFALQSAPPEASIALSPSGLTPKAGAFAKPVTIDLKASSRYSTIEGWTVSILDPAGKTVRFYRTGASPKLSWDGMTAAGTPAEPSTNYTVLAEVTDSYGNLGTVKAYLPVADLPPSPGENAILPSAAGFSPNGDGVMDSIDLAMTVTNQKAVKNWKVVITQTDKGLEKTFSGDASTLPAKVTWQGRDDSGGPAPEGSYVATMTIDYGATYKASTVASRRFALSLTPPAGSLSIEPRQVVPDEKGLVAPAIIGLDAKPGLARVATWRIDILDAAGAAIDSYQGDWPQAPVSWDGVGSDGKIVEPGTSYTVVGSLRDEFGVTSQLRDKIEVGALPAATEPSSVQALAKGFSPAAKNAMKFSLAFGNSNLIKSWSVSIERDDNTVRLDFPGGPGKLPSTFSWDGKLQDGTVAPDGNYIATLSIDYGRVYAKTLVKSAAFVLASTPPEGAVTVSPPLFSPDGDGVAETCSIALAASSRWAAVKDWSLDIYDPAGNLFRSFRGNWPASTIVWDGKNQKGDTVESAEDYPVVARVRDEFGNTSDFKSTIHVDILVVKVGDGYRIRVASIVFKAFTADWTDVPPDRAQRNVTTLNLLAEKLKKFPGYQIRMVGHAVMINWDDPVKGRAEQTEVLVPLSKARAEAIRQALIERGIEASRMSAEGQGALDPIVPDSDFENRWKNRRVEFFLQKKD